MKFNFTLFLLLAFGTACAQGHDIEPIIEQKDSLAFWIEDLQQIQDDLRSFAGDSAKRRMNFKELALSYTRYMEAYLAEISDTNKRMAIRKDWQKQLDVVRGEEAVVLALLDESTHRKMLELKKRERYLLLKIKTHTSSLIGSHTIRYRNHTYRIFIADTSLHSTALVWKNPQTQKRFATIDNVLKWHSDSSRGEVLLIANAGMYTPEGAPQGLYIEHGKQIIPLDTLGPKENLNFYLKPNGVFYWEKTGKAGILTTERFKQFQSSKNSKLPDFATQSGPMLVIDGELHPSFRFGSKNLNIRNGVGIVNQYKMVFSISNQPVNLYDFAAFYKDILGCDNALYLDGAISKMYQKDIHPQELGGDFGPMICIKKKATAK